MARTVADLAKLMDSMVGYDPDDPVTAHGVAHTPQSYSAGLDRSALKGARIGVLRQSMGYASEPESDDFCKVTEVFDRAVADLRKAGAEVVDPVMIPDLKAYFQNGRGSVDDDDRMFELFFKTGNAPFATRAAAMASPLFQNVTNSAKRRWTSPVRSSTNTRTSGAQRSDDQLAQGHGRPPVGRHRSQGRRAPTHTDRGRCQSALCRSKGRAAYQHVLDVRAVDRSSSGIYAGRFAGRHRFLGRPYDDARMIQYAYAFEQATRHRRAPTTAP